jgi:alkylresorcinol/alkylpyrone synthase
MKIIGAASAFPPHYYSQKVLTAALRTFWEDELDRPDVLERLHARACVDGRHLAYPIEDYFKMQTFGDFNRAWMKAAEELGRLSLCRALSHAGLAPPDIDAIFFVSVTGVGSPSIDAKLANRFASLPAHQAHPHFRAGLCSRRRRHRTRGRLCARISQSCGRAGVGGTLLAHAAEERSLHG